MLDLIIVAVVAGGLIHGFTTGLVRQAASLAGIVVAFVLGIRLMHPVGEATYRWIGAGEALAPIIGFLLVFLVVHIGVVLAARMVEKMIGALMLSGVNRMLGAAAGGTKVALALSIALIALAQAGFPGEETREESRFYAVTYSLMPRLWSLVSDRVGDVSDLKDVFRPRTASDEPPVETE